MMEHDSSPFLIHIRNVSMVVVSIVLLQNVFIAPVHACTATVNTPATAAACYTKLTSLTSTQLTNYISTFDSDPTNAGKYVNFGTPSLAFNSDGTYRATCQCSGNGDTCYGTIADNYPDFLSHNTEVHSIANNGDGTYPLLSSEPIVCDFNGNNYLSTYGDVTTYACYSFKHNQCPYNMTTLTRAQVEQYNHIYDNTANSATINGLGTISTVPSGTGFGITCQCATGVGKTCFLETGANFATFLAGQSNFTSTPITPAGTYSLLTSPQVTCDANGNNQINGSTLTVNTCYELTFGPNTNTGK